MAKKDVKNTANLGHGVGRRKTAVARVYLREGNGQITVNGKPVDEYFVDAISVFTVKQPLAVTETSDKFEFGTQILAHGREGQCKGLAVGNGHNCVGGLHEKERRAERSRFGLRFTGRPIVARNAVDAANGEEFVAFVLNGNHRLLRRRKKKRHEWPL